MKTGAKADQFRIYIGARTRGAGETGGRMLGHVAVDGALEPDVRRMMAELRAMDAELQARKARDAVESGHADECDTDAVAPVVRSEGAGG